MNNSAILEIVREGFEEQKGIKILSLYFFDEKQIHGVYIIPPEQSLSFLQVSLLDMSTDLNEYEIILIELGELLRNSYQNGTIYYFNWLIHSSEINCDNLLFKDLINYCYTHPPLLLMKTNFIQWIEMTNEQTPLRIESFIRQCKIFNQIDEIDYDANNTRGEEY